MLGAGSRRRVLRSGRLCHADRSDLSSSAVKLAVDAGVLAISLASLVIRKPFTLQYAREVVDAETAKLPGFMRANYIITWAWTAAFLLMMIGNVADDLCAGPAALVRTCDRIRRPQQRHLFHQMVSAIPQGEICGRRRPAPCPAPTESSSNRNNYQQRATTMKDVFARLGADFFSTIVFLAIYLATDNVCWRPAWPSPARWPR